MIEHIRNSSDADHGSGNQNDHHLSHDNIKEYHDGVLRQSGDVADLHETRADPVSAQVENRYDTQIDRQKCDAFQSGKQAIGFDR